MTVTPSVSTPVAPGFPGSATGADASEISVEGSGLFAQLMAALVPQAAPVAPEPEKQPTPDQAQDQAQDVQVSPTPPGLVATCTDPSPLHAPGLQNVTVPGRKATPTVPGAEADTSATTDPPALSAAQTTAPAVGPTVPTPNRPVGSPRQDSAQQAATGPTAVSLPGPTPASHDQKPSAEAALAPGVASPAAPTAAPTGVAPATSTSQATPPVPAAATLSPVSRQVIPELTRMSTLGEGVHRLTMTLRPEALGEVRVTMTVRDGSLHVRLAAGSEAQHALVPDLTELQQVLKLGSGSDVRVVLRDLAGSPAGTSAAPDQQSNRAGGQAGQQGAGHHTGHGTGQSAPTAGDPGTTAGSGHHSRREAGTPRDINATDGAVDGTSGSRSQTVRRVRPTGVDLTM